MDMWTEFPAFLTDNLEQGSKLIFIDNANVMKLSKDVLLHAQFPDKRDGFLEPCEARRRKGMLAYGRLAAFFAGAADRKIVLIPVFVR